MSDIVQCSSCTEMHQDVRWGIAADALPVRELATALLAEAGA